MVPPLRREFRVDARASRRRARCSRCSFGCRHVRLGPGASARALELEGHAAEAAVAALLPEPAILRRRADARPGSETTPKLWYCSRSDAHRLARSWWSTRPSTSRTVRIGRRPGSTGAGLDRGRAAPALHRSLCHRAGQRRCGAVPRHRRSVDPPRAADGSTLTFTINRSVIAIPRSVVRGLGAAGRGCSRPARYRRSKTRNMPGGWRRAPERGSGTTRIGVPLNKERVGELVLRFVVRHLLSLLPPFLVVVLNSRRTGEPPVNDADRRGLRGG